MDAVAQLDAWLTALGPNHSDVAEIRAAGAEPRWGIEFTDGLQVVLEADAETGGVLFAALLGVPPVGDELATAELALRANGVQAVVKRGYLAQLGTDGDYSLFQEFPVIPEGPVAFQDALDHFAETARRWRAVIAAGAAEAVEHNDAFDTLRV